MIEVYVKDGCPYCRQQLEQLDRAGVDYTLYNVSKDLEAYQKVKEHYRATQVPVVVEEGMVKMVGFNGNG
ncbi:MAG: glutaredoxin family protein [Firmicutes bacterium]|jgi:glutaredoxin|nr:glutaredoxin family protein [Bacillota bacterium]